jgi:hypothetical protein
MFANRERAEYLRSQGVTHVLNVSESPSIITADGFGFHEVRDYPVPDLRLIPRENALGCLDVLHTMLRVTGSRVYVHCVAGQNRSPTIIWLYFVACGIAPQSAKTLISSHTLDAVPGHFRLVDDDLVAAIVAHGQTRYLPLLDPEILTPSY